MPFTSPAVWTCDEPLLLFVFVKAVKLVALGHLVCGYSILGVILLAHWIGVVVSDIGWLIALCIYALGVDWISAWLVVALILKIILILMLKSVLSPLVVRVELLPRWVYLNGKLFGVEVGEVIRFTYFWSHSSKVFRVGLVYSLWGHCQLSELFIHIVYDPLLLLDDGGVGTWLCFC